MLPESINVLLLSVSSDVHIASLFPRNNALNEKTKLVRHCLSVSAKFVKPLFTELIKLHFLC